MLFSPTDNLASVLQLCELEVCDTFLSENLQRGAAIKLNLNWCVLAVTQTSDAQLLAQTTHGDEREVHPMKFGQKCKVTNRKHWQDLYLKSFFPPLWNWRKQWNNVMFGFSFSDYSLNCLDFTVKTKAVAAQLPEGNLQWEVVSSLGMYQLPVSFGYNS